ncbi:MAG: SDR family oxidoreductase [Peptococcaceae bacterium]|nr:SDR family oxidoreductase [Peptococcaceae bacterium]
MVDRNQELKGKVAIVTGAGAAGGLGIRMVRTLAEAGAQVVMTGRREKELVELCEGLKEDGLDVSCVLAQMKDPESVANIVKFAVDTYGRLDIAVNNAALTNHPKDLTVENMDLDAWDEVFTTNAKGYMILAKYSIPEMRKVGGGSIINISSGTSLAGFGMYTAYASTKGAINTMTKYIATQVAKDQIRCNALVLGLVATDVCDHSMPAPLLKIFEDNHILGRLGSTNDIAEFVRFLASDNSKWITGSLLDIDGGYYAHQPTSAPIEEFMKQAAA